MKKLIQIVILSILMFVGINLQAQTQTAAFKQGSVIYSHGTPSNSTFNPETKGIATHSEFCIDVDNHIAYVWNRTSNAWQVLNEGRYLNSVSDSLVAVVAEQDSIDKGTMFDDLAPYKEYEATIAQSSTGAPTATIMRNTLGVTPTWAYTSTGIYTMTATGKFTASKTVISINGAVIPTSATVISFINGVRTSADVLTFTTKNANITTPAVAVGNDVFNTTIRIRVYE